jgi:hypothetical protein
MLKTIGVVTVRSFHDSVLKEIHPFLGSQHYVMEWYPSFGCFQFLRNGCCNKFEASDFRCYIPSNLIVHASTISFSDGMPHFFKST